MSNWQGYLLKATKNNEIFPLKYIAFDTWESDPDHIEDVKAYRDDFDRSLHRQTATVAKSSFGFTTMDGLHLKDREWMKAFFDRNMLDASERKIQLEYWDDYLLQYKTGTFYIPNFNFKIKLVSDTDIVYNSYRLDFVEY